MTNLHDEIRKKLDRATFCYAKDGGQGFLDIDECSCGHIKCCQELKDSQRFHLRYKEIEGELTRREIIQTIKPEFEDSKWWKDNIVE